MKRLSFIIIYLILITVGAYLGTQVFNNPLAIYLTGFFVGDFSFMLIQLAKDS